MGGQEVRPTTEDVPMESPTILGRRAINLLNRFLQSTGSKGENLMLNQKTFGPFFAAVIEKSQQEKRPITNFSALFTATTLHLYDKIQEEKVNGIGYAPEISAAQMTLGETLQYILDQPTDVSEQFTTSDPFSKGRSK